MNDVLLLLAIGVALLVVGWYGKMLDAVTLSINHASTEHGRLRDEVEGIAASLRLMVSHQSRPEKIRAAEDSLVRWYFVTPDKRAGRVGADMGDHLLVLWLTDEHGERLNIQREAFATRGGLVQYPSARTGDWRFFSSLPGLELAMGWSPVPPKGEPVSITVEHE